MTRELLREGFMTCATIRHFEERVTELKSVGDIAGSVHLCNGQEAIAAGVCAALVPSDLLTCTYRGHGWAIAKGTPLPALAAELLGRRTGVNGGRGGSAYLSHAASGFVGENSIVGAGAPIATGLALASRFDGSGRVAVGVFGDGATNQGAVHEALNFAVVMRAPVLFVCENNAYSELTPIADMTGAVGLAERARAYGLPSLEVDGNDLAAVYDMASEAVARARAGNGPTFIEAHTQRLVGHYIGDVQQYRSPGEVERARETEPLVRLRVVLREHGFGNDDIDDLEADAKRTVDAAFDAVAHDQYPDAADLKEHLYA